MTKPSQSSHNTLHIYSRDRSLLQWEWPARMLKKASRTVISNSQQSAVIKPYKKTASEQLCWLFTNILWQNQKHYQTSNFSGWASRSTSRNTGYYSRSYAFAGQGTKNLGLITNLKFRSQLVWPDSGIVFTEYTTNQLKNLSLSKLIITRVHFVQFEGSSAT